MTTLTQSKQKRQIVHSLYLCKALMAFLVVLRHTTLWCREELLPLITIATPTFFCITGYFLFSASQERELSKATRWAKKGLILCLSMNLIYLLHHICDKAYYHETYTPLMIWDAVPFGDTAVGNFILNTFTGISYSYHLWYLSAFWVAMLLFYVLRRFLPKLLYATPLLYAWSHVCNMWGKNFFPEASDAVLFVLRCNGLGVALPFICTGYLLAKHEQLLLRIRWIPLWVALGTALLFFHVDIVKACQFRLYGWNHPVMVYTMVCLTLLLCLRYKNARVPLLNGIGQQHSANIYYTHILIYTHLVRTEYHNEDIAAIVVYLASIPLSYAIILAVAGWKLAKDSVRKLPMFACK